jgi:DNA-binding LacI/PurR family transcriptional regulator
VASPDPPAPVFGALLDRAPVPREPTSCTGAGAEVVSIGSSSDGAHLARVRTGDGADRELLVSILVDRGRVDVRVVAAHAEAAAWVQERVGRIREALEEAGLDLASLDLRQRHEEGCRDGRQGDRGGGRRQQR